VTDSAQPQPAQQPPDDAAPVRASRWRWAAPLLSVAVLAWLVARVTSCGDTLQAESKMQLKSEPASATTIAPPAAKAAAVEPAVAPAPVAPDPAQAEPLLGDELQYLGGSKSGFGGLGRSGTGRSSIGHGPAVISPPSEPAP
jgi:hypothetical protein